MPQIAKFKKGSILFFEGETRNNTVYLLKEGALMRIKISALTAMPERTKVNVGEFFGIKAGLGNFPRDETIQALTDITVYAFTPNEFITITKKNLKILFKMLTAFSNELRKIHLSLEQKLGTKEKSIAIKLLDIATYYTSHKKYAYASYALKKYIELYPDAKNISEINEKLADLNQIMAK
ncbi:hypothetical protein COTS27_01284 [Spirochaetota bacterium]|nr:hypothetical protein COTS27_01284 [Spirochaetota bacterium]